VAVQLDSAKQTRGVVGLDQVNAVADRALVFFDCLVRSHCVGEDRHALGMASIDQLEGKARFVSADECYIQTARLDLVAATIEHLDAELENPQRLATLLGAEIPPSWPPGEYNRYAIAFFLARLKAGGSLVSGWYVWYAIQRATAINRAALVACGGYAGPPSADGTVEIGYSVVPEARGRGYATELVHALATWAFEVPGARRILAESHVENSASIAVLERCGFRRIGPGHEPGYVRFQRDRRRTTEPGP